VNQLADTKLRDYAERLKNFGRAPVAADVADRAPAEVDERTPRLSDR
jgi:hypothetical protein